MVYTSSGSTPEDSKASWHDWIIVDQDVRHQHNQTNKLLLLQHVAAKNVPDLKCLLLLFIWQENIFSLLIVTAVLICEAIIHPLPVFPYKPIIKKEILGN